MEGETKPTTHIFDVETGAITDLGLGPWKAPPTFSGDGKTVAWAVDLEDRVQLMLMENFR